MTGRHSHEPAEEHDDRGIPAQPSGVDAGAVAEWVAVAAASGVVGNVAYDVIKAALRSARWPGQRRSSSDEPDRVLVARAAVTTRCAELGLPVPPFDSLTVESEHAEGERICVAVVGPDLRATVVLPRRLDGGSIAVTLHRIVPQQADRLGR